MTEHVPVDLAGLCERIGRPDEAMRAAATERHRQLVKPPASLGRIEDLSIWLAAVQQRCPPSAVDRARLVLFAADHGISDAGVSIYPPEATGALVRAALDGGTAANAFAEIVGAGVRVVDVGLADDHVQQRLPENVRGFNVRSGNGRIDVENACTVEEADQALRAGVALADEEVDAGADLLVVGSIGVANTTPAAAIVGTLMRLDASVVTGRGSGIDDQAWMRKCAAIRDAMRRARPALPDYVQLLASVGGVDFAAVTGFLLGASARRTPVVLDDLASAASALVAHRICYRAAEWWLAASISSEPAHRPALDRMSLPPLFDLGLYLGQGTAALLAVPMLRAAAASLRQMSTYDEMGLPAPTPPE